MMARRKENNQVKDFQRKAYPTSIIMGEFQDKKSIDLQSQTNKNYLQRSTLK